MNELQRYLARARAVWDGLSGLSRFLVLAVAALAVISTAVLTSLTATADYVPLATGLTIDEVGPITAQLDAVGIPYRAEASGSTLLVPKDKALKARVELAARGVTGHAGKGFELFDDTSVLATPFVQNVNFTRALQAELARSIGQLEPVASARVLIARGEPSPFVRDQQPTTASVVVRLKPGAALSRAAAAGIVSLVARSVDGLRPENVTVVDSTGRLLSEPQPGEAAASAGQLAYRRELEAYLSAKAEEMLARHLGAGRALVRVSADLNHQRLKETRERYSPDERAARSEQVTSSDTGGGGDARGVAGAGSNFVRTGTGGGTGGGRTRTETTSTDYLVSKTTQETETAGGALQRLTVAVLVDLSAADGDSPVITQADAEEIVKQAIGFQTGRDDIKVTNAHLAGVAAAPDGGADLMWVERAQAYVRLARNVSLAVGLLVVGAIAVLLVRRFWPAAAPPPAPLVGHDRLLELATRDPDHVARLVAGLLGTNGKPR